MCVCICLLHKSNAEYRLVVGPSCFSVLQEAQSGRTRGSLAVLAPVTHEAAQWDGSYRGVGVEADDMVCDRDSSFECDTSI